MSDPIPAFAATDPDIYERFMGGGAPALPIRFWTLRV
jgi:hypothetical protein